METPERRILEAQEYLNATDYKVIKWAEGEDELSDEVRERRRECRRIINEAQAEIELRENSKEEEIVEQPSLDTSDDNDQE